VDLNGFEVSTLGPTDEQRSQLRSLKISGGCGTKVNAEKNKMALRAAQICCNLECLEMNFFTANDGLLETLAEGCPNLTDLRLEKADNVTDRALESLGHHCKQRS
jgi:hypothetical protein